MRLFVAIETNPSLHPAIAAVQSRLRDSGADVKWTPPSQWHVTLKFLGEVEDNRAPDFVAAVRRAAEGCAPFTLRLGPLGTFPGGPKPRVVWARVSHPDGALLGLVEAVEREFVPLGFRRESQVFRSHLTLGRVKAETGNEKLLAVVRDQAEWFGGAWEVKELLLFSSDLKPTGAEYEVLERAKFGARVVAEKKRAVRL
ncbi:MAG: RNA 2',3'-cyclic phosphodiesterase [Planctomycetes bacterium]|nr:RNA 2',3'-cyclic phosphodiesterase [Planctomycetota bacterium]